ncbi:MAG TPA: AI-2E family transporter [Planctomycetota bacterium]|nr:AI-2E family transporter [Planctomycetota bacterium]
MSTATSRLHSASLIAFLLLLVLFTAILIAMVAPFTLAVLMGAIFAILTTPVYQKFRDRGLGPRLSAGLVTLGVIAIIIAPLGGFAYSGVKQGRAIFEALSQEDRLSFEAVSQRVSTWPGAETLLGTPEEIESQMRTAVASVSRTATSIVLAIASAIPEKLLQVALSVVSCFFLLIDGRRLVGWAREKIPLESNVRETLINSFRDTAISVIWATLAAAAAQALLMMIAFWALSIPGATLAGGATFIFAWIPVIGSTPVWAAGAIYLYIQGEVAMAVLMVIIGLLISVTDNFIRPMILKGRNDMHALVSLLAIFGGIDQFGIFGVFYGPILAAVVLALFNVWPVIGQRFGFLPTPQPVQPNTQ